MRKQMIPSISVITPTFNSENDLPQLIQAIKKQKYPEKKIELVIADGGSTDNTLKIAKKFHASIVRNSYVFAEPGIYVGMKKAKGDLLMILASDNIYEDKNAFMKIAKIFEDKHIYAAFPKHDSLPSDSLFSKYINTFTDPINHFVYGNAANARTFKKQYKTIFSNNTYDVYDFNSSKVMPILALAQGFTVRKKFNKIRKHMYDDVTPIQDIYRKNSIAYIHALSLYHHTIRNTEHYIRKQRWFTRIAIDDKRLGITVRSKYFTKLQYLKFYSFPLYAFSIVFPIMRSIIGFFQDNEAIWFFHPVISFLSAYAVSYELLRIRLGIGKSPSRQ